ncbi:Acid-sensing ion channel 1 [Frankliniella fusca]|uniref:Acid-sensing ion channel 1 n=1 Tax=Frankliniella fusca TaxID=407009 RepID=A0AAE1H341_9NEOP|nr:Acid-sensing ion channel 1 [Frankliniella fusca]
MCTSNSAGRNGRPLVYKARVGLGDGTSLADSNRRPYTLNMKYSLILLLALVVLCACTLVQCAPLDSDPTDPDKSEDWESPSDLSAGFLKKKKLLKAKLLLLG